MTAEDVLNYIDQADPEELQNISNAIKAKGYRPRIMIERVIRDEIRTLAEVLPKRSSEYNGKQFGLTTSHYVKILRDLTDVILKNYTIRKSERGYPMWYAHESILEKDVENYQYVFHTLTDTVIDLMEEFGTTY